MQVDVKHLKLSWHRFYQFTAIDDATRYRVLRIDAHNPINRPLISLRRSPPVSRRHPVDSD